jgi:hypothetical protein
MRGRLWTNRHSDVTVPGTGTVTVPPMSCPDGGGAKRMDKPFGGRAWVELWTNRHSDVTVPGTGTWPL